MAGYKIKNLFALESKPFKGLLAMEWAIIVYTIITALIIAVMFTRLHNPEGMLVFRMRALALMAVMWGLYRFLPCPLMLFLRVALQMALLADWYPDTYEFNRCFSNLDHIFCNLEHTLFGCQPSIEFSRLLPWGVISEPLNLGYVSYYPIIAFTALFYFIYRKQEFTKAVYIIMASFFMFYLIFIFVPVAGPTFYFKAVGVDIINQGVYPIIGNYFENHSDLADDCLPTPGWTGGIFWYLVEVAKWAGERPTAAFPSSHVGVAVVCMWLLWQANNRKVFYRVLPLAILLFFATFYIQAHYLIDALAGLIFGTLFYFILHYLWRVMK